MPYTFTVRMTPETSWEVVETWAAAPGADEQADEQVVFSGYAEYQAHCVAQALVHYVEHERPPQPAQEHYPARFQSMPPRRRLELVKAGAK